MIDIPGKFVNNAGPVPLDVNNELVHSVMVDQNYLMVATHIDESLKRKIINGEYVDFACLLPRDRVETQESQHYELVNRNGQAWYELYMTHQGNGNITSYSKWEQAFRVFSDIYTRQFPARGPEFVQYNHVIYSAATTYIWENVYKYDREFCVHMSQFPMRSWSIILQQAYTMFLKDRIVNFEGRRSGNKYDRDLCFRFNRGKCSYGNKCKFDHRCGICSKFGHGAHNCRKLERSGGDQLERRYEGEHHNGSPDKGGNKSKKRN